MKKYLLIASLSFQVNAIAGSWMVKLEKVGEGQGKICFVESEKMSSCDIDEANEELSFVLDDLVYIYAESAKGSTFTEWQGDCSDEKNLCRLRVVKKANSKALNAVAVFKKIKTKK